MKTSEVIEHYGSKAAIAQALGISKASVTNWGDEPPAGRQYQLQIMTKGRLKADATGNKPKSAA